MKRLLAPAMIGIEMMPLPKTATVMATFGGSFDIVPIVVFSPLAVAPLRRHSGRPRRTGHAHSDDRLGTP